MNRLTRWTAAFIGTLPVAVLAAVTLARLLPFAVELRFALGFLLLVPFWVTGICTVCLVKSGARAWLLCASLSGLLALFALL